MKQVIQSLKTGEISLIDAPFPRNVDGSLLIATRNSVISAGTERSLLEFGTANYLSKARQQPEKARQALDKIRTDGVLATIEAVSHKLDQPMPLGYSNIGTILEGQGRIFSKGDRVVSNGPHSDVVRVPRNLCARVPDDVSDEAAAFTVVSAVALQGIRLAQPTMGENVVVFGAGLIGQICIQLLQANGCRVFAIDTNAERCAMAESFGAVAVVLSKYKDAVDAADHFTGGYGMDAVIIAASSQSNEVIQAAAHMSRKRGRIVLIGTVGLKLQRDDFYKKELTFQISSSYGPGRYDPDYEDKGQDYPLSFVRWTAQRNFEAILQMMSARRLNVESLISHRLSIEEAPRAYSLLDDPSAIGIVLNYSPREERDLGEATIVFEKHRTRLVESSNDTIVIGVIGAGNYVSRVLIPALNKVDVVLDTLVTGDGISGAHNGSIGGFRRTSTDLSTVFDSSDINAVVIGTRHNRHAGEVIAALNAGKHVFVEKPLAITLEEIDEIEANYSRKWQVEGGPILMIGFNRRFAPMIRRIKTLLDTKTQPKSIIYTVNAGAVPEDHWIHDPKVGGGNIIGEVCHFVDLIRFLVGFPVKSKQAMHMNDFTRTNGVLDSVTITLSFTDGSIGTIHYFAGGNRKFPKERLDIFCGGAVLQMNNFRSMKGYGWSGSRNIWTWQQDKGNQACIKAFVDSIGQNKAHPISPLEIFEVSRETVRIANNLRK